MTQCYYMLLLFPVAWSHPLWCGGPSSRDNSCICAPQALQVRSTASRLLLHVSYSSTDRVKRLSDQFRNKLMINHCISSLFPPNNFLFSLSMHSDGSIMHFFFTSKPLLKIFFFFKCDRDNRNTNQHVDDLGHMWVLQQIQNVSAPQN